LSSILLKADGLAKHFGGIVALADYSVEVLAGELLGLIGPNGAGKTTVFNLLSGVLRPTRGRIALKGRDITGQRPDQNAAMGIARTFQNIRLFNALSVVDNVKVALHMHLGRGFWQTIGHSPAFRRSEARLEAEARKALELLDLDPVAEETAHTLPYGLQRRVEIARAVAAGPQLLLLDEVSLGLMPTLVEQTFATIRDLHRQGATILLVEQNARMALSVATRGYVLETGTITLQGSAAELAADPQVKRAYLGG